MELNHQIRLCRPFPFLFGFRAIFFHTTRGDRKEQSVQGSLSLRKLNLLAYQAAILPFPFIKSIPRKTFEKAIENRAPSGDSIGSNRKLCNPLK
jgi:hypothetical protein